jgi:hypothetical protein
MMNNNRWIATARASQRPLPASSTLTSVAASSTRYDSWITTVPGAVQAGSLSAHSLVHTKQLIEQVRQRAR